MKNNKVNLELIKFHDFNEFFKPFLDDKESKTLIKKVNLFNQKTNSDSIRNLEDLVDLDRIVFESTKGITEAHADILEKIQKVINDLTIEELSSLIKTIYIDVTTFRSEYLEIPLNAINRDWIPGLVIRKLDSRKIYSIGDVLQNKNIFSDLPAAHRDFKEFYHFLIENELSIFQDFKRRKDGEFLVKEAEDYDRVNLVERFKAIVSRYLSIITQRDAIILTKHFGLDGKEPKERRQIGKVLNNITRQRISQILEDHYELLGKILLGEGISSIKRNWFTYMLVIPEMDSKKFREFFDELNNFYFVSQDNIFTLLNEEYGSTSKEVDTNYLELLLRVLSIQVARESHKPDSFGTKRFSKETFYIPKRYNARQEEFLEVANSIYDILRETITPIEESELVFEVAERTSISIMNQDVVLSILENVPEFERIEAEENAEETEDLYQLRFDMLSTWPQRIERVLYEVGTKQTLDEIFELIEEKYQEYSIPLKGLKRSSVKNGVKGENITAIGKKGVYAHASLQIDGSNVKERIERVLRKAKKPLTVNEIHKHLLTDQGEKVSLNSTASFITYMKWKEVFPIKDKKYILRDWLSKYRPLVIEKQLQKSKALKVEQAYKVLTNKPGQQMLLSHFRKLLINDYDFYPTTAYAVSQNEDFFFQEINEKGKTIIKPKENPVFAKDKKTRFESLTEKAIEYLKKQPTQMCFLSEAVKELHQAYNPHRSRQIFYKIFNQDEYFEKSTNEDDKTQISLIPSTPETAKELHEILHSTGYGYNWARVKSKLIDELEDLLTDENQPIAQANVSVEELLDLFYRFLKKETGNNALDTLEEDVFTTIEKYFLGKRDAHDERLYHKAIILALEAILLKLIYFTNEERFQYYANIIEGHERGAVGLGKYMGTLQKIDPNKYRIKDPVQFEIPERNYSIHINRVYRVRNTLAHLGVDFSSNKNWTSNIINQNIKSSLTVMLFAIFLYRDQLNF